MTRPAPALLADADQALRNVTAAKDAGDDDDARLWAEVCAGLAYDWLVAVGAV